MYACFFLPGCPKPQHYFINIKTHIMASRLCSNSTIVIWSMTAKPTFGQSHFAARKLARIWLWIIFDPALTCWFITSPHFLPVSWMPGKAFWWPARRRPISQKCWFRSHFYTAQFFFSGIPKSHDFCQHFIAAGITKVGISGMIQDGMEIITRGSRFNRNMMQKGDGKS